MRGKLGVKKIKVGDGGRVDGVGRGVMIMCRGKGRKGIEELEYDRKE